MPKPFYITTTLPYVNAEPHIGFAMELVRADAIARYKKLQGSDVFFNYGTDEHGSKVWKKANELQMPVEKYVENCAEKYQELKNLLNLLPEVNFIRTTDSHHILAAREFWKVCKRNGHIYKKNYKIKYCVGCELEKTESELENGKCFFHQKTPIEIIDEENYFFKFSDFQKSLLDLYEKNPQFVVPDYRLNEIRAFVSRGLQDFSISRLKSKMPWGIPVPDDSEHVMYVWFDALVNYISAIGWPDDLEKFKKWQVESGGMVQFCGKDNLRQQSAMWQAMLFSAGLAPSKIIIIDGFITGEGGVKMSKSLGNAVNPFDIVKEYGADALRYYVLRELSSFEDSPFSAEKFKEVYNANLANGLGNLTARVMRMAEQNGIKLGTVNFELWKEEKTKYEEAVERYELKAASDAVWNIIGKLDEKIQKEQPFKLIKTEPEKGKKAIGDLLVGLFEVAKLLQPFMPETARKILDAIAKNQKPDTLFPRKE